MARREGSRTIAILPVTLKQKNPAGLRRLLVHKSKFVRAIAHQKFQANQRVMAKLLLPARAGCLKSRLTQTASRQYELANNRAWSNDISQRVIESVNLLLVQDLAYECKIERRVVDSPSKG